MPRTPRIEMAGFHHVINRGVEQRDVYLCEEDFDTFLSTLCEACRAFGIKVHAYALMSNHYHLLVETAKENLSMFMRRLNASYAIYFNRKYKRSGHLWQGRFTSRYVTDERYLYTLIRYVESNPFKAGLIKEVGTYDTGLSLILARDRALFKKRKVTQSQRGIYLKHGKGVAVGVG